MRSQIVTAAEKNLGLILARKKSSETKLSRYGFLKKVLEFNNAGLASGAASFALTIYNTIQQLETTEIPSDIGSSVFNSFFKCAIPLLGLYLFIRGAHKACSKKTKKPDSDDVILKTLDLNKQHKKQLNKIVFGTILNAAAFFPFELFYLETSLEGPLSKYFCIDKSLVLGPNDATLYNKMIRQLRYILPIADMKLTNTNGQPCLDNLKIVVNSIVKDNHEKIQFFATTLDEMLPYINFKESAMRILYDLRKLFGLQAVVLATIYAYFKYQEYNYRHSVQNKFTLLTQLCTKLNLSLEKIERGELSSLVYIQLPDRFKIGSHFIPNKTMVYFLSRLIPCKNTLSTLIIDLNQISEKTIRSADSFINQFLVRYSEVISAQYQILQTLQSLTDMEWFPNYFEKQSFSASFNTVIDLEEKFDLSQLTQAVQKKLNGTFTLNNDQLSFKWTDRVLPKNFATHSGNQATQSTSHKSVSVKRASVNPAPTAPKTINVNNRGEDKPVIIDYNGTLYSTAHDDDAHPLFPVPRVKMGGTKSVYAFFTPAMETSLSEEQLAAHAHSLEAKPQEHGSNLKDTRADQQLQSYNILLKTKPDDVEYGHIRVGFRLFQSTADSIVLVGDSLIVANHKSKRETVFAKP